MPQARTFVMARARTRLTFGTASHLIHAVHLHLSPPPCSTYLVSSVHALEVGFKCPPRGVLRKNGASGSDHGRHSTSLRRVEVQE